MVEMQKSFFEELRLEKCHLHAVRSDLIRGEVTITFKAGLQGALDIRQKLFMLAMDEQRLDLVLRPYQLTLPLKETSVSDES